MPTTRLADQRIRAASRGTLGLDVRGPVSKALAKTSVVVPPVVEESSTTLAEDAPALPAGTSSPPRSSRRGVRAATRVIKPFKESAWPTRRTRTLEPETTAGLTDDERRVQHALIDALDKRAQTGLDSTGTAGLSYAERKRLQALDLAFINAELAKMDKPVFFASPRFRLSAALLAMVALGMMAAAAFGSGGIEGGNLLTALALLLTVIGGFADASGLRAGRPERKRIYEALRELALVVVDPSEATSATLERSDLLIHQLTQGHIRTTSPTDNQLSDNELSSTAPRQRVRS